MTRKKIFKNVSWLFIDKIIRILGGLLLGIWVARYLGPYSIGILNYGIAFSSLFTVFISLGLDKIVVRELVQQKQNRELIIGTAFILKLFGAILSILFILVILRFINLDKSSKTIIILLSCGYFFQTFDVIDYFFQAKILSKYVVFSRTTGFLVARLFQIYFIMFNLQVVYFSLILGIELFLSAIFMIIFYSKFGLKITRWKFDKSIAISLLKNSWPLAISSFLILIHIRIDQIMIRALLNEEQVGIYGVAVRLAESWYFIPTIIINTLFPYFQNLKKIDLCYYKQRLKSLYSLMFWLGVFAGLFVLIFGQKLIVSLFGLSYKNAYEALVINIWNGIFISQGLARSIWLLNENLQKFRLYNNICAVIINITLNILLIPRIGISGAAIATFVTQFFGTWIISLFWKQIRPSTLHMMEAINPLYLFLIFKKDKLQL